jgi:hypothetical protein
MTEMNDILKLKHIKSSFTTNTSKEKHISAYVMLTIIFKFLWSTCYAGTGIQQVLLTRNTHTKEMFDKIALRIRTSVPVTRFLRTDRFNRRSCGRVV